jgi:putative ABC transport system substrate-binding protein
MPAIGQKRTFAGGQSLSEASIMGRMEGGGMNNRRKFLLAIGASAIGIPLRSSAQQPAAGMHRIGFLGPSSAAGIASRLEALRAGLRDLGYVEGKNLVIEFRWAEGKYDRLPELATELVRLNVELIITHSTPGVVAAKQATTAIPIVIAAQGDAVATGLVASLARPGGNITGSNFFSPQINAKRLELLKEVLPQVRRFGFLANPDTTVMAREAFKVMIVTAKSLKVELQTFDVRGPQEFESAFAEMAKRRVAAFTTMDEPMLTANAALAVSIAARHRIAAIGSSLFAEAGALMGYGPDFFALWRRAAYFVDKILKGARPGDLPIEQPTKFDLVVNKKTAKTLGIKIPQSILVRADKVIG